MDDHEIRLLNGMYLFINLMRNYCENYFSYASVINDTVYHHSIGECSYTIYEQMGV